MFHDLMNGLAQQMNSLANQYQTLRNNKIEEQKQLQTQQSNTTTNTYSNTIKASVGKGGQNNPNDALIVQRLLNRQGFKLTEDGKIGPASIAAIENFQRRVMNGWSDGRIDPNGTTWRHLSQGSSNTNNNNTTNNQNNNTTNNNTNNQNNTTTNPNPPQEDPNAGSGDFSHPNAANVRINHGANAVKLNARATKLLQSILASCNINSATVTSTLRTYHDQARITMTQTSDANTKTWYGQDVLDAKRRFAGNIQAFATWWADRDKRAGILSSRHLSGIAMDVVPDGNRQTFANRVQALVPVSGSGVRRIIPKGTMGEPVDHVEFTFQVTNQTATGSASSGAMQQTEQNNNTNNNTNPNPNFDAAFLARLERALKEGKGQINQAVGKGQSNQAQDVLIVKALLKNRANYNFSYDPATLNQNPALGQADSAFIQALETWQKAKGLAQPDGVLSPSGTGMRILNGEIPAYGATASNNGQVQTVDAGLYQRFNLNKAIVTVPKNATGAMHVLIIIGGISYANAAWMLSQTPANYFQQAVLVFIDCAAMGGIGPAGARNAATQILTRLELSQKSISICGFSGGGPEAGANPSSYKAVGLIDPTPNARPASNILMLYNANNWAGNKSLFPLFTPLANQIKAAGGRAEVRAWGHKGFPASFFGEASSFLL